LLIAAKCVPRDIQYSHHSAIPTDLLKGDPKPPVKNIMNPTVKKMKVRHGRHKDPIEPRFDFSEPRFDSSKPRLKLIDPGVKSKPVEIMWVQKQNWDVRRVYTIFLWTSRHDEAFEKLKALLAWAVMRSFPDYSREFYLFTDASKYQIG
jgi:hypothetical protein